MVNYFKNKEIAEDDEPITVALHKVDGDEIIDTIEYWRSSPTTVNIKEWLNNIDRETCSTDLLNLYESLKLDADRKKQLAKLLAENASVETLYKFLSVE